MSSSTTADDAFAIATSPSGSMVFVAGSTAGDDYATVAYDAATGAQVWASQYAGPAGSQSAANAIAVSPRGSTVFVTGSSLGPGKRRNYATIAYDAATGAMLWVRRYSGSRGYAGASALALSPSGRILFVTGSSGAARRAEYATIAYSAATGTQLWTRTYSGSGSHYNAPVAIAASPDGRTVVVTGSGYRARTGTDIETVAYDATSGKQVWAGRYKSPARGTDQAASLAISPNAGTVYVTGFSSPTKTAVHSSYVTIAYNAATGRPRWISRYARTRHGLNRASSVAVAPSGQRVFVTGESQGSPSKADYATVAYDANSGRRLWVSRYNGPVYGRDIAVKVAVSPAGNHVYVTGNSWGGTNYDYATVGYGAVSGSRLWLRRYDGAGGENLANAMAVGSNSVVYVTGASAADESGDSYQVTTIAYQG
jgi:hypothetical protein